MIGGPSGILSISHPNFMPKWEPTNRRLLWLKNGRVVASAHTYSSDVPSSLRGPEHDGAWADELASWYYPEDTWRNLMLGLRAGKNPQTVVTTTPRPTPIIKRLVEQAKETNSLTIGTTYENAANLAPGFLEEIIKEYEGTRLGNQELLAQILDDNPNALWKLEEIELLRVPKIDLPPMDRIVVAVDPEATASEASAQTGILVVGISKGKEPHGYVLEDLSMRGTPAAWGEVVVRAYCKYKADRVVAEVNNGGDMVEYVVRTVALALREKGEITEKEVSYKKLWASRGKVARAEPVSALYEKKKVHHVGVFKDLEMQLTSWEPGNPSPDRMDALVWALTELMLNEVPKSKKVVVW
jgi:phage terminase large subunit-like protein